MAYISSSSFAFCFVLCGTLQDQLINNLRTYVTPTPTNNPYHKQEFNMDYYIVLLVLFFGMRAFFHFFNSYLRHLASGKVPPGPFPFPIIGNILQLGRNPHRSLAKLSRKYGPLMSLQLGNVYTVVVSSPEIAKEIIHKNDHVFGNRTIATAAEAHEHHKNSMIYLPIGTKWRTLRKICTEYVFSTNRLEETRSLRGEKIEKLFDYIQECSNQGKAVDIGEVAFITSINLISGTLFSYDVAEFEPDSGKQDLNLKEGIEGVGWILGSQNLVDFLPFLKMIDIQDMKNQSEIYFGKLLEIFGGIINKRLQARNTFFGCSKKNDVLETLLDLSEGNEYDLSCKDIKHLLLDLFVLGSDTTASTIEWAMTELLLHPMKMQKAINELKTVVVERKRVQESDISRLPYLQAVVKETLRYHPTCPFLIPRKSKYDVEINGYVIPRDTQLLVNLWAMGRDPNIWSDPDSFEPERFIERTKIDHYQGQDFGFIPFGSGRRTCPGYPLAHRMLHLILASFILNFDWRLEPGLEMDITEDFGLSLHKAVPLKAIPFMN